MQYTTILIALCSMPVGTSAASCPKGFTFKTATADVMCKKGAVATLEHCTAPCCTPIKNCDSVKSSMPAKCTAAEKVFVFTAADRAKLVDTADEAAMLAACCTATLKTCAAIECGRDEVAVTPASTCGGTTGTACTDSDCCKAAAVCNQMSGVQCADGSYNPKSMPVSYDPSLKSAKNDAMRAEIKAWETTAATDATKNTACCTKRKTCAAATFTCAAGYKKTATADKKCKDNVGSCSSTTSEGCCELDALTCQGVKYTPSVAMACAADTFEGSTDTWKAKTTAKATWKTDCCAATAPCGDVPCGAGDITKADATCNKEKGDPKCKKQCCINDPAKCYGFSKTTAGIGACGVGSHETYQDLKEGTAAADAYANTAAVDATAYKAKCCTKTPTCADFKAAAVGSAASGADNAYQTSFVVLAGVFALVSL